MHHTPIAAGKSSFELVDSERFFEAIALKEGSTFLDVAGGAGAYSIAASPYIGPSGKIYAVDLWMEDSPGPPMSIRLSPKELEKYLMKTDFQLVQTMDIGRNLYLSIFIRS